MPAKKSGDTVLTSGDVKYRMEDLLKRRRGASLSGQHRETQRYDKEIMILRAALGMAPKPPEEIVRTRRLAKDPTNGENLAISSLNSDISWIYKTTVKNIAKLQTNMEKLGYSCNIEKGSNTIAYIWSGFKNGKSDNFKLTTIGKNWALAAERNGERLSYFVFNEKAETAATKGLPKSLAMSNWNGQLDEATKQQYVYDWNNLVKLF